MTRHLIRLGVLLAMWLLQASAALAHDRTLSFSTWTFGDQVEVELTLNALDLEGSGLGNDAALAAYAAVNLTLRTAGQSREPSFAPQRVAAPEGRIRLRWALDAAGAGRVEIRSSLFQPAKPGHLHFVRVVTRDGANERVLTNSDPAWTFSVDQAKEERSYATLLGEYLALGVEHIATGLDHLVFLLALLLVGRGLRDLVAVVTAFTVGHSISLAASVFGLVQHQVQAVEALIGLSIVIVAVESEWARCGRDRLLLPITAVLALTALGLASGLGYGRVPAACWWGVALFMACHYALVRPEPGQSVQASTPWPIALIFGLIHGLGFASALVEAGLPAARLSTALVGFNVGVELGQLGLVIVAWPLLRGAVRWRPAAVIQGGAAICAGMGMFWLQSRGF